jgi:adenosyl cobinamide kinase/adenosyl cobinamide phosphate guanylyltransferase
VTLVVLLGGARSGKSRLAVEIGRDRGGEITFVATAEDRDDEMAARVARHRAERPAQWRLIEEPCELADLDDLAPQRSELLIIDCLPLWLSNMLETGRGDDEVLADAALIASLARERLGPVIAVTNEVGLGVVPATPLGRRFRDLLGGLNQTFVAEAEAAFLVVAGRLLRLPTSRVGDVLPR